MDQQNAQSLRTYLTTSNPNLTNRKGRGRTNTRNPTWALPHELCEWRDFNVQSLLSMCNGDLRRVLDQPHAFRNFADLPPYPFCQIVDENSLEKLLVKWTQSVITEALEVAQKDAVLKRPNSVYMVSGGQAKYKSQGELETTTRKGKQSYPDWAAIRFRPLDSNNTNKSFADSNFGATHNILPGDTKISAKWKSAGIRPGPFKGIPGTKASPIIQIFNYCLSTESRYGYLITDKELFAVRISALRQTETSSQNGRPHEDENQSTASSQVDDDGKANHTGTIHDSEIVRQVKRCGRLEYKSILWTDRGENRLTINLALFWLHILASIDNTIQEYYEPLSQQRIDSAQEEPSNATPVGGTMVTSSFNADYEELALSERDSAEESEAQPSTSRTPIGQSRKRSQAQDQGQQKNVRRKRPSRG